MKSLVLILSFLGLAACSTKLQPNAIANDGFPAELKSDPLQCPKITPGRYYGKRGEDPIFAGIGKGNEAAPLVLAINGSDSSRHLLEFALDGKRRLFTVGRQSMSYYMAGCQNGKLDLYVVGEKKSIQISITGTKDGFVRITHRNGVATQEQFTRNMEI